MRYRKNVCHSFLVDVRRATDTVQPTLSHIDGRATAAEWCKHVSESTCWRYMPYQPIGGSRWTWAPSGSYVEPCFSWAVHCLQRGWCIYNASQSYLYFSILISVESAYLSLWKMQDVDIATLVMRILSYLTTLVELRQWRLSQYGATE